MRMSHIFLEVLSTLCLLHVNAQPAAVTEVDVAIVGGGIAGIKAANQLLDNGVENIVLLEASDRLGGRIHNVSLGDWQVDLGAQYIHGTEGNPLFNIARMHKLVKRSVTRKKRAVCDLDGDNSQFFAFDGTEIPCEMVEWVVYQAYSLLEELDQLSESKWPNYTSVGDFLNKRTKEELSQYDLTDGQLYVFHLLYQWFKRYEILENGAYSLDELSIAGWHQYEDLPGDEAMEVDPSFAAIIQPLIESIPAEKIKLNKEVVKIVRMRSDPTSLVKLECRDGSVYQSDYVIVTSSLGYLKQHADTMFQPPLPKYKRTIIDSLGFGTVGKIFLLFEKPFWNSDTGGLYFLPDLGTDEALASGPVEDVWQDAILGFEVLHPNVLLGWIGGRGAEYMETLTDEEVMRTSVKLLKQYLGRSDIPNPTTIIKTAWKSNPYVLGAYSYVTVESEDTNELAPARLAIPVPGYKNPKILFAGEATHPYYFQTAHGALLTGEREANRILEQLA